MELRHLRYFVAVAEEGSFSVAAEKRLHTAQPSLSRQIHDLELELGVQLFVRGPRGIELTPSGRVFLDHARVALLQVEAAAEAATGARTLTDGTGVVANYQFYFASKKFLQADAKIVELVLAALGALAWLR